ncbi:hypothetical protein Tcan_09655 [Toxocara canis]|uniref:Domain of unknown function DB domain-containing protein n=1 Tax=Toxocara canis TaxID=6265 RepID=A0A0B2UZ37_TOXCA|nr:hypothetical protein Tcan_09655 [Toxocara canis]
MSELGNSSVSSYGLGNGLNGSSNWTTRGVGGVSSDSYLQQGGGIFATHSRQQAVSLVDQIVAAHLVTVGFSAENDPQFLLLGGPKPKKSLLSFLKFFSISPMEAYLSGAFLIVGVILNLCIDDFRALIIMAASSFTSAKEFLPPCDNIPKLLCCTDRILLKCFSHCTDHIVNNCPHKLNNFKKLSSPQRPTSGLPTPLKKLEVLPDFSITETDPKTNPRIITLGPAQASLTSSQENIRRNGRFPMTTVTDADLLSDCGTQMSRPPYSPCLSRKMVDELFLSCCQQHAPSNCHSICTYEHHERVAAEILIQAVQEDRCDLKYMSVILYCANRNRDNRKCCEYLGLADTELGVGSRCLRMCNVGQSGDRISTLEMNDLVCLSNWNVIMYCARAGLRTIN